MKILSTVSRNLPGLALFVLLAACSDDSNPIPDITTQDTGNDLGSDALIADGTVGVTVEVVYSGTSTPVALDDPAPVTLDAETYARLSDVVALALPETDLETVVVDFEGADGFQPAFKDFCKDLIPLGGATLTQGYVHVTSRNMRWDDSLGFPGCMRVGDLAKLMVTDR
jgi:hypothetical protein